jgi:hypothetical protein
MPFLDNISGTNAPEGMRAVIAGIEGVGKTTLVCNAPRALLIPVEEGYSGVKVQKIPTVTHYEHLLMFLDEVKIAVMGGKFMYQSLVFDSLTAIERLIHAAVLEEDPTFAKGNKKALTMESAHGGYGKAYLRANEKYELFLNRCNELAKFGKINIICTSHIFASKVSDPTVGEYEMWDLLLHSPKNNKTYGKREMTTQWADMIGFLHEPIMITESGKMNRGITANKGRILSMARAPGFVAKNRYNVVNDIVIPVVNPWNAVASEIYTASGYDIWNRDV